MHCGLGNLISIKRHVLPPDLQARTTWDARLADIGRGVAGLIEKFCNRKFERLAGATDTFTAARTVQVLQRYPIESITTIETQDTVSAGWTSLGTVSGALINWHPAAGVLEFGAMPGTHTTLVRVTYTGGCWFSTDEDEADSAPAGATTLPADVRLAWLLQSAEVWNKSDKLGAGLAAKPDEQTKPSALDLTPAVKALLAAHRRMQLS